MRQRLLIAAGGLALALLPLLVAEARLDETWGFVAVWLLPFLLLAGLQTLFGARGSWVVFALMAVTYLGIVALYAADQSSTSAFVFLWLLPAGFGIVAAGALLRGLSTLRS